MCQVFRSHWLLHRWCTKASVHLPSQNYLPVAHPKLEHFLFSSWRRPISEVRLACSYISVAHDMVLTIKSCLEIETKHQIPVPGKRYCFARTERSFSFAYGTTLVYLSKTVWRSLTTGTTKFVEWKLQPSHFPAKAGRCLVLGARYRMIKKSRVCWKVSAFSLSNRDHQVLWWWNQRRFSFSVQELHKHIACTILCIRVDLHILSIRKLFRIDRQELLCE